MSTGMAAPLHIGHSRVTVTERRHHSAFVIPSFILHFSFFIFLCLSACGGSPQAPSDDPVAVIRVVDETFRIRLDTPQLEQAARAARAGTGPKIPAGRIVAGTDVNEGYSWHLEDVQFVEVTIELCDGRPSDVQRDGLDFGGGRYCPWGAVVVTIEE